MTWRHCSRFFFGSTVSSNKPVTNVFHRYPCSSEFDDIIYLDIARTQQSFQCCSLCNWKSSRAQNSCVKWEMIQKFGMPRIICKSPSLWVIFILAFDYTTHTQNSNFITQKHNVNHCLCCDLVHVLIKNAMQGFCSTLWSMQKCKSLDSIKLGQTISNNWVQGYKARASKFPFLPGNDH